MADNSRTRSRLPSPGPYLAEVTNHLDPTFMGGVEVIIRTTLPSTISQKNTYVVKYMTPFYGVTSARFEGNNPSDFNDVQKSYGWWAVPPDVGTTVMVIFVNSDPNQGYWIGCVPDTFQNHMVPGIAATSNVALTPGQREIYGTSILPTGEFNKKTNSLQTNTVNKTPKPVHPFADRLKRQGLLLDNVRGVTSSSARREVPSMVFGISTPGPLDPDGKKGKVGYVGNNQTPVSRLGGSTFVMDDGDINGNNELVRIRTRTGHQILLHNSQDLIYIANSAGTTWIELTSNGKIDVYAEDSISMHTVGDFNFKADRDFNLESGRNFNIYSGGNLNMASNNSTNFNFANFKTKVIGNYDLSITSDFNLKVGGKSNQYSTGQFSIDSGAITSIRGTGDLSLIGTKTVSISATTLNLPTAGNAIATKPNIASPAEPGKLNLIQTPAGNSIMQRVPTREPYSQHENINPALYGSTNTDAYAVSESSANKVQYEKAAPGVDRGTYKNTSAPWSEDAGFLAKIRTVCAGLGFEPIDLIAVMMVETGGTLDPAIKNPKGSATGLIQFLESTICTLSGGQVDRNGRIIKYGSVRTSDLAMMRRVEQMDWVDKYFRSNGWPKAAVPKASISNIYMTVFLPKFSSYPGDTVIARRGDRYYNANTGFDPNGLGYITPNMVAATAIVKRPQAIEILSKKNLGPDLLPKK